ncbi:MAG: PqqD family protein [Pyrinomonadaceae bacterium]
MELSNKPLSRKRDLVVQDLDNEVLIYDLTVNKAYCLNKTSSMVWQECDGKRSVAEISQILSKDQNSSVSEDVVWLALKQFKKDNLLSNEALVTPFDGLSRRETVKRIGLTSMAALPLIASLVAPTPIHAQSATGSCNGGGPGTSSFLTGTICAGNLDCCSGICMTNQNGSMTCGPPTSIQNINAATCCPNFVCNCSSRSGAGARPAGCGCASNLDCCSGICMTNQDQSMTCGPPTSIPNTNAAPCCG